MKIYFEAYKECFRVYPERYLEDLFVPYLEAVRSHGGVFKTIGGVKCHVLQYNVFNAVVNTMKDLGFEIDIEDKIEKKLTGLLAGKVEDVSATRQRLEELEANTERGFKLLPFQREDVMRMSSVTSIINANPTGSGKTIETLMTIRLGKPVIVLACMAIAKMPWMDYTKSWRPEYTTVLVKTRIECQGALSYMLDHFAKRGRPTMYIMNPELLPPFQWIEGTFDPPEGITLVTDEAQEVSGQPDREKGNQAAKWHELAGKILRNKGRHIILTATPLELSPMQLYNMLRAGRLLESSFGGWVQFKREFGATEGAYGVEWGDPRQTCAAFLNKVMIARSRDVIMPFLPKIRRYKINLGKLRLQNSREADDVLHDLLQLNEDVIAALNMVRGDSKLARKIASLRRILALEKTVRFFGDAYQKFKHIPHVLATCHRDPCDIAQENGYSVIKGGQTFASKRKVCHEFQEGKISKVILTVRSGGTSITLNRSSVLIFLDEDWNPFRNYQVEGRLDRIGQENDEIRIFTCCFDHPLETHLQMRLEQRRRVVNLSIGKVKQMQDRGEIPDPLADLEAALGALRPQQRQETELDLDL